MVGTQIASLAFHQPSLGPDLVEERRWDIGKIIEYKDSIGRVAQTGTYDELAEVSFSNLPSPGSSGSSYEPIYISDARKKLTTCCSGGPIFDVETGAVVGLVRGHSHKHGDPLATGFGTPIEKLFDVSGFTFKVLVHAHFQVG